jgi:hypothetical protein
MAEGNREEAAVGKRQYWNSGLSQGDWMDEIFREQEKKGALNELPGKGKPLELSSGDVMNGVLKNANILPEWILLRHKIKQQIEQLLSAKPNRDADAIQQEIAAINQSIRKYNMLVPASILQKSLIRVDNLEEQYRKWI